MLSLPPKGKYRTSLVFEILAQQGRRLSWLADKTGFSAGYICHMRKRGRYTQEFVDACTALFELPEAVLFCDPIVRDSAEDVRRGASA